MMIKHSNIVIISCNIINIKVLNLMIMINKKYKSYIVPCMPMIDYQMTNRKDSQFIVQIINMIYHKDQDGHDYNEQSSMKQ